MVFNLTTRQIRLLVAVPSDTRNPFECPQFTELSADSKLACRRPDIEQPPLKDLYPTWDDYARVQDDGTVVHARIPLTRTGG